MPIRFPFRRKINVAGREILSPIVPVTLESKGFTWRGEAKLDIGADYCGFDDEVADELDLVLDQGERVILGSWGGVVTGYLHPVRITVDDGRESQTVRCLTAFAKADPTLGLKRAHLLGQHDFLDAFRITLCAYEDSIELERVYYAPEEGDTEGSD